MPVLLLRLKQFLHAHRLVSRGDKVLLAVSGGPDSMALLELFCRLAPELQLGLHVVHLNHQFRGAEAAEDAEFVRQEAAGRGIPATILSYDVPAYRDRQRLSSQDAAHRIRYALFLQVAKEVGAARLAVAHHRDDRVETVLLNILRGTGPEGLRGMEAQRRWTRKEGLFIIRPLLDFSREEILEFLKAEGIPHRLDRSNLKPVYLRNKVRLQLLPLLEKEYNPALRDCLLSLSDLMGDVDRYLGDQTHRAWKGVLLSRRQGEVVLDREKLVPVPAALQGRLLRHALEGLLPGMRDLTYRHIRGVQELAARGKTGTSLDLPGRVTARISYGKLYLFRKGRKKSPERGQPLNLAVPGEALLPGGREKVMARVLRRGEMPWPPLREREALLDYDRLAGPDSLTVRCRRPGDRFQPLGLKGTKKLKDFLMDRKIPRQERDGLPLVTRGGDILWVVGLDIHDGFKVTGETRRVLHLQIQGVGTPDLPEERDDAACSYRRPKP